MGKHERFDIVKIAILPKLFHRVNVIPIKNPASIFAKSDMLIDI